MKKTQSEDKLFRSIEQKWKEVIDIPPQTMGPLTPLYKRAVPLLKTYPWRVLLIVSIMCAVTLYFLLGSILISITSILQKGF